ncbi:MAG: alcohol dehydrogenase catalytic domain-containing protein, partial [Alistipes sp.]|nr:alcohol dehydrogenase catalytic domain-containing protein [Alistipes sp.]
MKALQIIEAGNIKVTDINKPTPAAGEILLRVRYVGFCGSDLNTFLGKNPMVKMPVVPGHEISATIEQIGQGVPTGFQQGMRVTVNPYTNCGTCASCRNGRVNACEFNQTLGVQRNGSMQE